MGLTRLNHAVAYVGDVDSSVASYCDVLGMGKVATTAGVPAS